MEILPDDILRFIFRIAAASTSSRAYFCVSKHIAAIYKTIAKWRSLHNPMEKCLICYEAEKHHYPHLIKCAGRPSTGSHCDIHRPYLLIDRICEECLATAIPRVCAYCKIPFMDAVKFSIGMPVCTSCWKKRKIMTSHGNLWYGTSPRGDEIVSTELFPYTPIVYTGDKIDEYISGPILSIKTIFEAINHYYR